MIQKAKHRGLSLEFLAALKEGLLFPLRERVNADRTLCLELRCDSINVYYRGGSLVRVSRAPGGYAAFFETKYFEGAGAPFALPDRLREPADVATWLSAIPLLKQSMDLFLGRHPKDEREIQQMILRDNNIGAIARSTDYFVCDIEYANLHGRFDLVAVRWPSTPPERKTQDHRRLVLAEVKHGDGALTGDAGLHQHILDVNSFLADQSKVTALKEEMMRVFNQKRALDLVDCEKDLQSFSDEAPLLLLILVNHDPGKSRLRELLGSPPPSPHAELRIATGCLLGYGLYDPAILTIGDTLARFTDCI